MQEETFDVVIAGGGMVGASLAVALSSLPLKIALVEAFPAALTQQAGYDDRAIALSYGSRLILQGMGVWPMLVERVNPIDRIHISDRGHFGATRLSAKQQKVPALGYLIEAQVYTRILNDFLSNRSVKVIQPARMDSINFSSESVVATISSDNRSHAVRSKLMVACDGADSAVRKIAGVGSSTHEYQQVAIIANVTTELAHDNQAFERFTPEGPIALLPMSDQRCSLVWTTSADNYQSILDLNDDDFLSKLGDAFGYRLGRFVKVGRRGSFPLKLTTSDELTGPRLAIIGNAAHSLHPVAGQGLNLALRDIADLAEQVVKALGDEQDIGAVAVLAEYALARDKDTARTIQYTDSLVKIFSNEYFLLGHARAASLTLVDRLLPLRTQLARQSMGLKSRSSRLSRGLPLLKEPV